MKRFFLLCGLTLVSAVYAQVIDNTDTRVQTTLDPGLVRIGTLNPKSVHAIGSSRWALGCETIDREYSDYDAFAAYLPPLGIKKIRLQGGWARCERDPGIYDFAWLDHIIDDARARGLEIWLETSYGNPIYKGGGGRTLADGFPDQEEGLQAWDKWVDLLTQRYQGRVRDWSVWNEPELRNANKPEKIVDFTIRTAEIIKRNIPDARIAALSLCTLGGDRLPIVESFVKTLKETGKTGLFTWIVYHHYTKNPDENYGQIEPARKLIQQYAPNIQLWQGESGTQSEYCGAGALSKYPWSEITQAKWLTRRMLGDIGHGVVSSVFTAADLDYRTTSFHNGLVRYGLIKTTGAAEGFKVLKVKTAYYAVQNVVSVFNDNLELIPDYPCAVTCERAVQVYGHQDRRSGSQVCVFWDKSEVPSDFHKTVNATLKIKGGRFKDPVWVDTITGGVYAIPPEKMGVEGDTLIFRDIPVYDAAAFITEKTLLEMTPSRH